MLYPEKLKIYPVTGEKNSKFQAPNSKQRSNSRFQVPMVPRVPRVPDC
jgi:hypothetical protein